MNRRLWLNLFLCLVIVASVIWTFQTMGNPLPRKGFSMFTRGDNSLILSDEDVLSYNASSQEIVLTDAASQRLQSIGDALYNYANQVSIKIDNQEIYRGLFRAATMSALPAAPAIGILYPEVSADGSVENYSSFRLFYPSFQPPSDLAQMNAKLIQYFDAAGRLVR
jgi:hypothetical protein